MRKKLYYFLPVVVWMIIIFLLSSKQRVSVSEEYALNFLFFKTLHVVEYAVLYILGFRAFLQGSNKNASTYSALKKAFVLSLIYAMSDELHQTFVPTREGTVRDVFIDLIGISLMYTYIRQNQWFVKKYLK